MDINVRKCAYTSLRPDSSPPLLWHGVPFPELKASQAYKYLGVHTTLTLSGKAQYEALLEKIEAKLANIMRSPLRGSAALTAIRETVYPCIEYALAATILSVPHVRLLEKKLTAAIRKVLGLPKSTSLTYLIMPEDQLGLGVCSLEARYYFLTSTSFESILSDKGLVGQFSTALLRDSMRAYGCRQEAVAASPFYNLQNTWLRKVHILTHMCLKVELSPSFLAHADETLGPPLVPVPAHVLSGQLAHARLLWQAGFFQLSQFSQPGPGPQRPFTLAEFCDSFRNLHGCPTPAKLKEAYASYLPHLAALLAAQPPRPPQPQPPPRPAAQAPAPSRSSSLERSGTFLFEFLFPRPAHTPGRCPSPRAAPRPRAAAP